MALLAEDAAEERGSEPTSVVQENAVVSEEQASSRPVSASESTKEEGSRPASKTDDKDENIKESLESAAGPTDEETTRAPSSVMPTEERSNSVTDVKSKEDDVAESENTQENDAEDTTEKADSRPSSTAEINKEQGSRPASVIAPDEPLKNEAIEGQETSSDEIKEFVDSELEQIPPEPVLEETSRSRPASSVAEEQEDPKQSSRPSSSIQEGAEDGRSTAEVGNESRAASAAQPTEMETEVSEISEDERKLEDEEPTATLEDTAEPESSQLLSGSVPSLTVTEVADEPRSDDEIETQAEEEAKPSEESEEKETSNTDDKMNSAATTIQATFRGFQARQALSKSADVPQVG